jgi:hypothetical protein
MIEGAIDISSLNAAVEITKTRVVSKNEIYNGTRIVL